MEALGLSMDMLEALVRWNPLVMDAMLQGRPPPPPPAGLCLREGTPHVGLVAWYFVAPLGL